MSRGKDTRKAQPPKQVPGGRKRFGAHRTSGLQIEYAYRRLYPLDERDIEELHKAVTEVIRRSRNGYHRFFFSVLISVLGGLYQVRFGFKFDEDDAQWEHQWLSTPVVKSMKDLIEEMDELLTEGIDMHLNGRPCWLLRFRVVFLANKKTLGKVVKKKRRRK